MQSFSDAINERVLVCDGAMGAMLWCRTGRDAGGRSTVTRSYGGSACAAAKRWAPQIGRRVDDVCVVVTSPGIVRTMFHLLWGETCGWLIAGRR
jgi:hypothetical protein